MNDQHHRFPESGRLTALTVGGFDPLGVSGIQADLKVFSSFGLHGLSVLTALLAQNNNSVRAVVEIDSCMLADQLNCLFDQNALSVIKVGWLQSSRQLSQLAGILRAQSVPIVYDPVLATSSGYEIADGDYIQDLIEHILPLVAVFTPNLPEASAILGRSICSRDEMESAAKDLKSLGPQAVLIKGGHFSEQEFASDFFTDGQKEFWLTSTRRPYSVRGTGCCFASAIASGLANGLASGEAAVVAKTFVNSVIRNAYMLPSTAGVNTVAGGYLDWPSSADDLPLLTYRQFSTKQMGKAFPQCELKRLKFYPIVKRAEDVNKLIHAGVQTIQLRIKDLQGIELWNEIQAAIEFGRQKGTQLFINDYWEAAIELGAFGVHLGQEDLLAAEISAIRESGLRLGISTHSYEELAVARLLKPSYIAFGPIFPTTCKSMQFAPQGLERITNWRRLCHEPLIVIGGLKLDAAASIFARGADGMAVISDILDAECMLGQCERWLAACSI